METVFSGVVDELRPKARHFILKFSHCVVTIQQLPLQLLKKHGGLYVLVWLFLLLNLCRTGNCGRGYLEKHDCAHNQNPPPPPTDFCCIFQIC